MIVFASEVRKINYTLFSNTGINLSSEGKREIRKRTYECRRPKAVVSRNVFLEAPF